MSASTETKPAGRSLESTLAQLREHGVWILAAAASIPSWKIWSLVTSAEAAKHAPRIAPVDILIALLAIAAAVEVVRCGRDWKKGIVHFTAFVWVGAAVVSVVAGQDVGVKGAIKEVVQLVEVLLVAYGWMRFARPDRRGLERVLMALAGAVTIHALLAWGQLLFGAKLFHVRGLLDHRNSFGVLIAVVAPLLVSAGLSSTRHIGLRAWYLAVAALAIGIVSSAGILAACVLGVSVAAFMSDRRWGAAVWVALVLIIVALQPALSSRLRDTQVKSVMTFPMDHTGRATSSARMRRLQACVNAASESLTFGAGVGMFQGRISEYYMPPYEKPHGSSADVEGYDIRFDEPGSQSLFEVTAVEMGLLGLLAVSGFLAAAAARLAGGASRDTSGITPGALGAVLAVIVSGVFTSVMVRGVAIVFMIVIAAGERAAELKPEGEGSQSA